MALSSAQKVKDWRNRWKSRILTAFGGKCSGCGYDVCTQALQLHHLDPKLKEISFNFLRAQPKAALSLINELKGCVLVCANCHTEIHYGTRSNPISTFDEKVYRMLITPSAIKK